MIHFLHGNVGMAEDWQFLENTFASETRAVDLWRFLEEKDVTLEKAGERLVAESAPGDFLIGYSMGGRIALHALLAAPNHWAGALIISAHPGLKTAERAERISQDAAWAKRARNHDWPDFLKQWNEQNVLDSRADLAWGNRLFLESRREAVARSFEQWSLGRQEDLREPLSKLARPVLWMNGENDAKFSALGREMAALSPTITHQVVANAGHRVPWENPGEFCDRAKNLLEKPSAS